MVPGGDALAQHHLVQPWYRVNSVPRPYPGHYFQECTAEWVHVSLLHQFTREYLWRQVDRGAYCRMCQCKCFVNLFGDTLVSEMRVEVFIYDYVRWFQISMHNIQRMQVFDGMQDIFSDANNLGTLQEPVDGV